MTRMEAPAELSPPTQGRISVVIPVFNGEAYLRETLQSVRNQTLPVHEIIVVDDGSTDGTAAIARSLGATVISQEKRGPAAARNVGTNAASGDLIAYLDADDLWTADKLAVQWAALRDCSHAAFSFTDFRVFDRRGTTPNHHGLRSHPAFVRTVGPIGNRELINISAGSRPVLPDNYILPSSVLVRRADVLRIGGFDETIRIWVEDFEFLLRLFAVVPAIAVMRPLLLYRRHDLQVTSKTIAIKAAYFDLQRLVQAAPDKYPPCDARYIVESTNVQHFRIGIEQARIGSFDDAIASFRASLSARWTIRAYLALRVSRACSSVAGRRIFSLVRAAWKARPMRR